jgi:acyl carrier protein
MNVREIVTQRFTTVMKLPENQIKFDASLAAEYGMDSIRALKLISQVEVEFDIEIERDEARSINSLNDVIKLVERKIA